MEVHEIRKHFTKYFVNNGHLKQASSSLIPYNDPTLLFANAGMNQFKDYFTGKIIPKNKRAVTIQKCVRAGGKHNDLDNVGFNARHHTFFEMLGNFSFGDYFKESAIKFAWEFLTSDLKIPKNKLFITVHHTDDEAYNLWKKIASVRDDRIFRKGDKDNFWEMGEFGPCGPCSEIFYDHGEKYATSGYSPNPNNDECLLDDETRYVEIWNLVFMQFEKTKEGIRNLPHPSIDTGAGLERIAAVMQEKYWNYDTDIFLPIISQIEKITGKSYSDKRFSGNFRVIADHVRSTSMLITDGVIPSNEGRGYVLRRIIRRAIRHLKELNAPDISLYRLVPIVFEGMGKEYPQNASDQNLAEKFLKLEEEKFLETLDVGLRFLSTAIKNNVQNRILSGKSAFKLYDTYGFPVDLTETILSEQNLKVDIQGFNQCMEERRNLSKQSWKGNQLDSDDRFFYEMKEKHGENQFVFDEIELQATLLDHQKTSNGEILIFDQTPFYAESGGQVGDQGKILDSSSRVVAQISDTQKPMDNFTVHITKKSEPLEIGKKYSLIIDKTNRQLTGCNHSATHLLHSALSTVLGPHVKQAGSLVGSTRLRFDFTHLKALTKDEIESVSNIVNNQIKNNLHVTTKVMSTENAIKSGAKALFGEKYGDDVRVVRMGNNQENFSIELCGGTHVQNTGEIGYFNILSESALSTGVRRIEALTSDTAITRLNQRSKLLSEIELIFNTKDEQVMTRIESLMKELKSKNKEINKLKDQIQNKESKNLFDNPEVLNENHPFIAINAPENSNLRKLSDSFISKYTNGIIFIHLKKNDKMSVLLRTGKDIKSVNCPDILNKTMKPYNGRGGGRPDMAQGSCDNCDTQKLITSIKKLLISSL